jgi:septal ring factor EnvC (AmiA/AmiB activator)
MSLKQMESDLKQMESKEKFLEVLIRDHENKLKEEKEELAKLKREIVEKKWDLDPIGQCLDYFDGKISDNELPEIKEEHGGLEKIISGAYGDWKIYKDGYEEYDSMGD